MGGGGISHWIPVIPAGSFNHTPRHSCLFSSTPAKTGSVSPTREFISLFARCVNGEWTMKATTWGRSPVGPRGKKKAKINQKFEFAAANSFPPLENGIVLDCLMQMQMLSVSARVSMFRTFEINFYANAVAAGPPGEKTTILSKHSKKQKLMLYWTVTTSAMTIIV